MKKKNLLMISFLFFSILLITGCTSEAISEAPNEDKKDGKEDYLILATTTSTQDSGLLDVLIPEFEKNSGYMVKTIAVGTGKALEMGDNGEADVLLVHAPDAEMKLVENGSVINRKIVMHNDFVIVGPRNDPAGIKGMLTSTAFETIKDSKSLFISRGDDSGTHKMEKKFWEDQKTDLNGQWYQETGQGMGGTLNVANEKKGYTLTDRATYLALRDDLDLDILVEGDEGLLNVYHVMQVNPEKFQEVHGEAALAFLEFMVSNDTQKIIKEFGVDKYGQPLFFPDAK